MPSVLELLSYAGGAAVTLGGVWPMITQKSVPQLLEERGWLRTKSTAQAAQAAPPSSRGWRGRIWNIALMAVGLALIGVMYFGQSDRSALAEARAEAAGLRVANGQLTTLLEHAMGKDQAQAAIASDVQPVPLGRASLETRIKVTPETHTPVMEELRRARGLRPLSTTEELGYPLIEMPSSSYAGVYPGHFGARTEGDFPQAMQTARSHEVAHGRYEVHRTRTGEILFNAFIAESDLRATELDGQTKHTVDTFSDPLGDRTALISIPASRVLKVTDRPTPLGTSVEFTIH